MPTARELLEQADALMRRNRQVAAQDARPAPARGTTAAFPTGAAPGDRSAPATAPAFPLGRTAMAPDSDIPVLDEIVVLTPPPVPVAADDEFPVLTDAIDEIDVALPVAIDGEPSDWLLEPSDDQSVLGPSPPSVALVPTVEARAPRAPEPWPARSDATAPLVREPTYAASATATPVMPPVAPPAPGLEDFDAESPGTDEPPITVLRAPSPAPAPIVPPAAPASWLEELVAEVPMLGVPASVVDAPAAVAAPFAPEAPQPEPVATHGTGVADSLTSRIAPTPSLDAPVQAPTVAPASASSSAPPRDESWEALAEEIRMQVLQRIDLFTDTGLRERLGERLKPIVDRASADLVATINQHVGELLRAYVAEAIEREIERWRSGR